MGQLMQASPHTLTCLTRPQQLHSALGNDGKAILGLPGIVCVYMYVPRIFSVAGQFFDDLRRKLDDNKLEKLMQSTKVIGARSSSTERRQIYLVNGDISI
jgi:hypothetical protein